jgi:hypothetical protein
VLRAAVGGTVQRIDLKITARQIDAESGTIGLNVQSDEALLQDFGLVSPTPDRSYWANQDNVRSIIYNVMNRALGPGLFALYYETVTSPSFRTYSAVENLIVNGAFENGVTAPWFALNAVLGTSTAFKSSGSYSLQVTPNTTAADSFAEQTVQVEPGQVYTASAWIGVAGAQPGTLDARARRIWVYGYIDGQVVVLGQSAQAANTSTATRLSTTFTVPLNMQSIGVRLYSGAASGSGASVYWDSVMTVQGDGRDTNNISTVPYFDGATEDTPAYNYEWTGATNASTSRRIPIIDRGPDALTWSPGQSAWDFLTPILQAVGWRLVPNLTDRGWTVKSVDSAPPGGTIALAVGSNLYSLTDLISRTASQSDGTPLFADAVLIHYTWTDSTTGEAREAYDSAGPAQPQKVHLIDRRDTAYPGAGAAAYVLGRLATRRRQLTVDAAEDYDPLPGRDVLITGPRDDVLAGTIDAITWDFTTARMTVKTKDLISIPALAVGRAPTTQTVGSVTTDLARYTN